MLSPPKRYSLKGSTYIYGTAEKLREVALELRNDSDLLFDYMVSLPVWMKVLKSDSAWYII